MLIGATLSQIERSNGLPVPEAHAAERLINLLAEPARVPGAPDTREHNPPALVIEEMASGPYLRLIKPAMDRMLGFLLLLCILPVLFGVAVAVRIRLGRGVIYRQTRVGVRGQPFTMLKFRSMRPDLRTSVSPFVGEDRRTSHKTATDPRHTPLGRFLRKTSLDELPQFWNVVVRGDMSLVGPRPELASVVATYDPWQHQRHLVKPGLTGMWQVHRRHNACPMRDDTDIDLTYIRELSMGVDLRILLATVPVLLGRTGS